MKNLQFVKGDKVEILVGTLKGCVREVIYADRENDVWLFDEDSHWGLYYANHEVELIQ